MEAQREDVGLGPLLDISDISALDILDVSDQIYQMYSYKIYMIRIITRYIRYISTRYIRCIRLDISDVFIQDIYDTYHYQIYQMYHHQIYQGPKHRCRLYGIDKVRISTQTLAFFHLFLFPTTMHPEMRCFLQNRYVKRKKYFWKMDIIQPSNISSKINIYTKGTFSSKRILPHFPLSATAAPIDHHQMCGKSSAIC